MSSFSTTLLDQHLHRLNPGHQLSLSRRAAERYAVLEAVRELRRQQSRRPRRSGQRLRRLLAARSRAKRDTSPPQPVPLRH